MGYMTYYSDRAHKKPFVTKSCDEWQSSIKVKGVGEKLG